MVILDINYLLSQIGDDYYKKNIMENAENQKLLASYERLEAPAHLLALSCNDAEKERELTELFIQNNVNYKRSNQDIEMIYVNAKAAYEKSKGRRK